MIRPQDLKLAPNEKVLVKCNKHWISYLSPIFWVIIAIATFVFLPRLSFFGFLFSAIAIISICYTTYQQQTVVLVLTNMRVFLHTGLFTQKAQGIPLSSIANVEVKQNIFTSFIDLGKIIISTAHGQYPFEKMMGPLKFRRCLQEQIQQFRQ